MATVNVGVVSLPRILENVEKRVIAGNLKFKIVYNSHFITILHVKVGVVGPPRITEMLNSYS